MLRSMTGFGVGRASGGGGGLSVELRCVNHRFREVKVRLPREISSLEPRVLSMVSERIERGVVEVTVRYVERPSVERELHVDKGLAGQLVEAMRELKAGHGLAGEVRVSSLMAMEGVVEITERPLSTSGLEAPLEQALGQALDAAVAMRVEEGRALAEDLLERLDVVERALREVESEAATMPAVHKERLRSRIETLLKDAPLDSGRLEAEVAFLADRSDITEEITRLRSHIEQLRSLARDHEGGAGRSMGFLLQELNREVNTIGSKSQSLPISRLVVDMKAELERMREQVQNIE